MDLTSRGYEQLSLQLENLKAAIREVSHDINNPVGVVRMAAYFLESTDPDAEKRAHYFKVINESLDRIEESLKRLRGLRENPPTDTDQI